MTASNVSKYSIDFLYACRTRLQYSLLCSFSFRQTSNKRTTNELKPFVVIYIWCMPIDINIVIIIIHKHHLNFSTDEHQGSNGFYFLNEKKKKIERWQKKMPKICEYIVKLNALREFNCAKIILMDSLWSMRSIIFSSWLFSGFDDVNIMANRKLWHSGNRVTK